MTDTPWQIHLREHEREWFRVALDVDWITQHDAIVGQLGLNPNAGYEHAAEAVSRDPDTGGLALVNVWARYRAPGTHTGEPDAAPPPFTVA